MDLYKTIRQLQEEKEHLDRVIESLERLSGSAVLSREALPGTGRRGRKSMSPEERREVSARMRKYWEQRRNLKMEKPPGP